MLHRLYDWVLRWAQTPHGSWALFVLAFCESSFFPLPPDVLLIALAVAVPKKSFRYALICSVGSVLGGCFGYLIGWKFMAAIGNKIILFYDFGDKFNYIKELYHSYDAWAVAVAGFTPIPYKVFTISAGAFSINFAIFLLASLASRSARFYLVAGLIFKFGPGIQAFIEKYFNVLAVVFTILLLAGFAAVKYWF